MYNMSPYSLSRSFRDKPCRAVIYGRASTEHEAQVKALPNQMQWYDDVARFHPQWNVSTATSTKALPELRSISGMPLCG